MPSHQARRDPLPADYQFPTPTGRPVLTINPLASPSARVSDDVARDIWACPQCHGPSLRGDLCFNCTAGDSEGQYGHGV